MEFAVRTRHLARVYVDAQSVTIGADWLQELTKAANLAERMGTQMVLHVPLADPALPAGSPPRFALASTMLDWQLALLSHSFDLTRLPSDVTGSNIGDVGEFAAAAAEILWECCRVVGRPAHRMALVQGGLLAAMPDDRIDTILRRLMKLPPGFDAPQSAFEWDWRVARHGTMALGDETSDTNLIAKVARRAGNLQTPAELISFDRIHIELDVNTSQGDARGRFGKEEIRRFFLAAAEEHTRLADALSAFAFEDKS